MDGYSYYPPGAGLSSLDDTGGQSSSNFSLAVLVGVTFTILSLLGVMIQLFRGRNCFMRCEENVTDANPAITMVQVNGTNSNPGTHFVVPMNGLASSLSTNHVVSLNSTNSNPSTSIGAPLNDANSYISSSLMAPLSTTSSVDPINAPGSNPVSRVFAPSNVADSMESTISSVA